MITTKILNQAVGVQRDRAKDKTETATLPSANNGIIVGAFKRGRADKPFKVTRDNYKAILGRDIGNPSYMAVEDAFMRGIKELWVCRLAPGRPPAQGLAKDYSGSGWYKATDTGIVYNKGVPEGETHIFEGDTKEYISVYQNNGFDIKEFSGTEEDFKKLYSWLKDADKYATSNVTDMSYWLAGYGGSEASPILSELPVDIDISHYDTSKVTNMESMFGNASSFNQDISGWDTSNVINMARMFLGANSFNQDISNWDVNKVTNMDSMFWDAHSFNQDLSKWCVAKISSKPPQFDHSTGRWTLPKPVWGTCPRGEN